MQCRIDFILTGEMHKTDEMQNAKQKMSFIFTTTSKGR